jgi:hypothetical protein
MATGQITSSHSSFCRSGASRDLFDVARTKAKAKDRGWRRSYHSFFEPVSFENNKRLTKGFL